MEQEKIKWWKDRKLVLGVVLITLSFTMGFFGKLLIIVKFYEPIYWLTGISIYAFSFLLLFTGAFLLGWEIKAIQARVRHHVGSAVRTTYRHSKNLTKRGYDYTKKIHKRWVR